MLRCIIFSGRGVRHSALIPDSLMIGSHFAASAFTSAPSASGVWRSRGKMSSPRDAKRDRTHVLAGMTPIRFTHYEIKYERTRVRTELKRAAALLLKRKGL